MELVAQGVEGAQGPLPRVKAVHARALGALLHKGAKHAVPDDQHARKVPAVASGGGQQPPVGVCMHLPKRVSAYFVAWLQQAGGSSRPDAGCSWASKAQHRTPAAVVPGVVHPVVGGRIEDKLQRPPQLVNHLCVREELHHQEPTNYPSFVSGRLSTSSDEKKEKGEMRHWVTVRSC